MCTFVVFVIFRPSDVCLFEVSHQFGSLFTGVVAHMTLHAVEGGRLNDSPDVLSTVLHDDSISSRSCCCQYNSDHLLG